jgi:hypothetical protein
MWLDSPGITLRSAMVYQLIHYFDLLGERELAMHATVISSQ